MVAEVEQVTQGEVQAVQVVPDKKYPVAQALQEVAELQTWHLATHLVQAPAPVVPLW